MKIWKLGISMKRLSEIKKTLETIHNFEVDLRTSEMILEFTVSSNLNNDQIVKEILQIHTWPVKVEKKSSK